MKYTLFVLSFILFLIVSTRSVQAASATINVIPATGNYAAPFQVQVVIDGHGEVFNAARAKVTVSENVRIQDMQAGDCHFAFTHEPTIADPSFEGVILGSSTSKCTVYSMTLMPIQTGSTSLQFTNTTIRRYGDAAEMLAHVGRGQYALTAFQQDAESKNQMMSVGHTEEKSWPDDSSTSAMLNSSDEQTTMSGQLPTALTHTLDLSLMLQTEQAHALFTSSVAPSTIFIFMLCLPFLGFVIFLLYMKSRKKIKKGSTR